MYHHCFNSRCKDFNLEKQIEEWYSDLFSNWEAYSEQFHADLKQQIFWLKTAPTLEEPSSTSSVKNPAFFRKIFTPNLIQNTNHLLSRLFRLCTKKKFFSVNHAKILFACILRLQFCEQMITEVKVLQVTDHFCIRYFFRFSIYFFSLFFEYLWYLQSVTRHQNPLQSSGFRCVTDCNR